MKTNVQSIITDTNASDISGLLAYYGLIDIGTIVQVDENKRAVIKSCYRTGDQFTLYKDVELIFPGCATGAFITTNRHSMCLILVPRTCIPDIGSRKIDLTKGLYNERGVKAMPISNGANVTTSLSFNDSGDLLLASSDYTVTFSKEHITATMMKKLQWIIDDEGQFISSFTGKSGSVYRTRVEDLSVKREYITEDSAVRYITEISGKGDDQKLVIKQVDGSDKENLPIINAVTIKKDGSVQIARQKQGNLITIDVDGNVTVDVHDPDNKDTERNVTINATNVNVNAKNSCTVKTTDSDINLDAASNKVVVKAGNVELMGNTKNLVTFAELDAALDNYNRALVNKLNTGVDTYGKPVFVPPFVPIKTVIPAPTPEDPDHTITVAATAFDISAAKAANLKTK